MNIWQLEPLFVLDIQIFYVYILLLVTPESLFYITKMVSDGRKHVSIATVHIGSIYLIIKLKV